MGHNLEPQNEIEKEEENRGFQNNGFNQFRSDRIPLEREVPDTRDPRYARERERERERDGLIIPPPPCRCVDRRYSPDLPTASVVIIFHNEAYTVLLRTITSVIIRSPAHLLQEIILVDDFSDHGNNNCTCARTLRPWRIGGEEDSPSWPYVEKNPCLM